MTEDFDLIIMDIMMPKVDGFAAYKKIRQSKEIPVIMLSAKGEEYDKLYGFELGIDDYVVKPFSLKELMARANVVIRRNQNKKSEPTDKNVLVFEGLTLNITGRKVLVDGEQINLTPLNMICCFSLPCIMILYFRVMNCWIRYGDLNLEEMGVQLIPILRC